MQPLPAFTMAGLDPATRRARVRERKRRLFGARTRVGWAAASRAAMVNLVLDGHHGMV
jgi:hypothetical protein